MVQPICHSLFFKLCIFLKHLELKYFRRKNLHYNKYNMNIIVYFLNREYIK